MKWRKPDSYQDFRYFVIWAAIVLRHFLKEIKCSMAKKNVWIFLVMQLMNVVFSLNSVLMKLASVSWQEEGLFAFGTIMTLFVAVAVMGIYAVAWQAILGKVDLSQAYLNKGTVVFWGLLWSALIFKEQITPLNIAGSVIIFMGLLMVNGHE